MKGSSSISASYSLTKPVVFLQQHPPIPNLYLTSSSKSFTIVADPEIVVGHPTAMHVQNIQIPVHSVPSSSSNSAGTSTSTGTGNTKESSYVHLRGRIYTSTSSVPPSITNLTSLVYNRPNIITGASSTSDPNSLNDQDIQTDTIAEEDLRTADRDEKSGVEKKKITGQIAIIAHPYGSLGGSMDDHVVQSLVRLLVIHFNIPTVIYNSRGSGGSEGRASWTGDAEAADYQSVVDWAVGWLENEAGGVQGIESTAQGANGQYIQVICCGYSYGSLMASRATSALAHHQLSYLLISPPLGVAFFLTLFRSSVYETALRTAIAEGKKVLIVYGDEDTFTSSSRYQKWTSRLLQIEEHDQNGSKGQTRKNQLIIRQIKGADHFWTKPERKEQLLATVTKWME